MWEGEKVSGTKFDLGVILFDFDLVEIAQQEKGRTVQMGKVSGQRSLGDLC